MGNVLKFVISTNYENFRPGYGYPSKVGHSMPSAHAWPRLRSAFPFLLSNLRRVALKLIIEVDLNYLPDYTITDHVKINRLLYAIASSAKLDLKKMHSSPPMVSRPVSAGKSLFGCSGFCINRK